MQKPKLLEYALTAIGTILLAMFASMTSDLGRIARSVEDLNIKAAVSAQQYTHLDGRVSRLEDWQKERGGH